MKTIFKIICASIMIILSGCGTIKKTKVLLPISWINMESIGENIYADIDMSEVKKEELLSKIPLAKRHVKKIWGSVSSSPKIYACSTEKCFKNLGGNARAHQIFNNIILSPRALKIEMISHEWSHTELVKRVDNIFGSREIPSWFDEGVAVIVSNDTRHNEDAWNKIIKRNLPYPEMNELKTLQSWYKAVGKYQKNVDTNEIVVIYAAAGHAVNKWYKKNRSKGLVNLVAKVKKGGSFSELYNNLN